MMTEVLLKLWRTPDLLLESAWTSWAGDKEEYLEDFDESKEGFVVDQSQLAVDMREGLKEGFRERRFEEVPPRPAWLDEEKLRRGQRFANEFLTGVSYSQMISLYVLFADPEGLKTLIATDRSSCEFTAFKRYLSTSIRIWKWYDGDLLDEGSEAAKSLKSVWLLHRAAYDGYNRLTEEEMERKTDLSLRYEVKSSLCPVLAKHLREVNELPERLVEDPLEGRLRLSQVEMSLTLFSFVGFVCLYPNKFGVRTTAADMDGFLHLWRYVAYRLGVREERNVCAGTLQEVRNFMYFSLELGFKPLFRELNPAWEHMSRAATDGISRYGPKMNLEVNLLFLFELMGLECPMLKTPLRELRLAVVRMVYRWLGSFSPLRHLVNYLVKRKLTAIHEDITNNPAKYIRPPNEHRSATPLS